jgi:hypothetical protein
MGIKQIEKLYEKMISFDDVEKGLGKIDAKVRTRIFQKIMDDVERLQKKMKRCRKDSKEYIELDCEIRRFLLKEIQVIIDDYVIAEKNGTLKCWKDMYGDINHYISNFYMYREEWNSKNRTNMLNNYGLYDQEHL